MDYSSLSKNIGEYLLEKPQKRVFFNGVTCVALIAAICWIYWGTRYFAFVTFDDGLHIVHNPAIRKGFSWEGVQWAFTTVHGGNWHPLTWLSFLLDYERHGLRGGGYHWTNVLIHILNSLILFRVLSRMTSQAGKSAFVAALFAVHPLHVESVAWISERKDVLSATFAFLVLDRYVTYIRHKSAVQSLLVFILYGLGLMSKAMLVSLPILMLLLDYWPLRRYESRTDPYAGRVDPETFSRLMLEKAPLFALALLFSWVTYRAQLNWNAVVPLDALPIDARVGNALVSYTAYLGKMVWPANLSIFYPYERTLSAWQISAAAISLVSFSLAAVGLRKKAPYLLVGWSFYLISLVPVIGIVQVGSQSMADRYVYLPLIGLFMTIAWGVPELMRGRILTPALLPVGACAVLIVLSILSRGQVQHWRDSETLFRHALTVTKHNDVAYNNLGVFLLEKGDNRGAYEQFVKAAEIRPKQCKYSMNAGVAQFRMGEYRQAMTLYLKAIATNPSCSDAYFHLGNVYFNQGNRAAATEMYEKTLRYQKDHADAHNGLAMILTKQGRYEEAKGHLQQALRTRPDFAEAWNNKGVVLAFQGRLTEAVLCFDEALRLNPSYLGARKNRDEVGRRLR